jgi:hypothetical protein
MRGNTFSGTWLAGEKSGRYTVNLILEWPLSDRREETVLSFYAVDSKPPRFDIQMVGAMPINGVYGFQGNLEVIPRFTEREPLSRWRFALYADGDTPIGEMSGTGELPPSFVWTASDQLGRLTDGRYKPVIEIWDLAGNMATASQEVEIFRKPPEADLTLFRDKEKMVVDLKHSGRVPIESWRLEMWTIDGTILLQEEGAKLPVKKEIALPAGINVKKIQGYVAMRDTLGNKSQKKIEELVPFLQAQSQEKKPAGTSEGWVDQF